MPDSACETNCAKSLCGIVRGAAGPHFRCCLSWSKKIRCGIQARAGWVLGGAPISYREIEEETGFNVRTLERWMHTLRRHGYIQTEAAPAGIVVRITKAKKFPQAGRKFAEGVRRAAGGVTQNRVANQGNPVWNQQAADGIGSSSVARSQEESRSSDIHREFPQKTSKSNVSRPILKFKTFRFRSNTESKPLLRIRLSGQSAPPAAKQIFPRGALAPATAPSGARGSRAARALRGQRPGGTTFMSARMKLRREVGRGGFIPSGWQLAWYEPRRRIGVYYPAPLHWLMRAVRELVYRLGVAVRAPGIERSQVFDMQRTHRERQRLADEYARGYLIGWRECFHACLEVVEEELTRSDDVWEIGDLLTDTPKLPRDN